MNTNFFDLDTKCVAWIPRNASHATSHQILKHLFPADYDAMLASINAPEGVDKVEASKKLSHHRRLPHVPTPSKPVLMVVREPIQRFKSACAMFAGGEVDRSIRIMQDGRDHHYIKQIDWVRIAYAAGQTVQAYKLDAHLTEFFAAVGVAAPAPPSGSSGTVEFTPEQQAVVEAFYAEDLTLYASITEAGQFITPPPSQQEVAQAAYDAAAALFDALPKGKQKLWEPTRVAVAHELKQGNFAEAKEILETTPAIYQGAEDDRQAFLALFP